MARIKVMIVDDDFYVREALEMLIRKNPKTTVAAIAACPSGAIEQIKKLPEKQIPDIIILDVKFENDEKTGIDLIKEIKQLSARVKILISSMSTDEKMIIEAIASGADGYVWKNESAEGIVGAIEKVVAGRFLITKSIAAKIIGKAIEMNDYSIEIMPDKHEYHKLTEELRKTVYLYCFCGMSAKEIADELCISVHTVNSRIKNSYLALQATNKAEAFERLVKRSSD